MDLETLETQGLLDPEDGTLDFARKRENLRPMALYRIQNEFLLCYDGACVFRCCVFLVEELCVFCLFLCIEFAFYVNKSGQRTRNEFMVFWEGQPTGFGMDVFDVLSICN